MPGVLEQASSDSGVKDDRPGAPALNAAGPLPKGVVLGKDGKPCRSCTSSAAWMSMMKQSTKNPSSGSAVETHQSNTNPSSDNSRLRVTALLSSSASSIQDNSNHHTNCPPDVEELGHSSWTLLHSLTATYPPNPTPSMQSTTKQFITLFSTLYPCWSCADDFRSWMAKPENDLEPELRSQERFGRWMCRAHNEVNRKLGKQEFDCNLWKERWRDGWKDGRCG